MSESTGGFLIQIGADMGKFVSDMARAERVAGSSANNVADKWEKGVDRIGSVLGKVAGLIAGAFVMDKAIEAGHRVIELGDQFAKLGSKVGISTESLSALKMQADLSGVPLEALQGGMVKLAKNAADAAGGNAQLAAAFKGMGINVKDANGNLRSTEELFGDMAAKFSGWDDSAQKAADATIFFGKSGADLIPLLNSLGQVGFKGAREEAEKYGLIISGETAKASEAFNDNLTKLKMSAEGYATQITSALIPSLKGLTDVFVQEAEQANRANDAGKDVAGAIQTLIGWSIEASGALQKLGASFGYVGDLAGAVWGNLKSTFIDNGGLLVQALSGNLAAAAELQAKFHENSKAAGIDIAAANRAIAESFDAIDAQTQKRLDGLTKGYKTAGDGVQRLETLVVHANAPMLQSTDAVTKAVKDLGKEYTFAADDAKAYGEAQKIIADQLDKTARYFGGPAVDAALEYRDAMVQLAEAEQKAAALGPGSASTEDLQRIAQARIGVWETYQDKLTKINNTLSDDQRDALQRSEQAVGDWVQVWTNAGDRFAEVANNVLFNGANLFSSLKSLAKDTFLTIVSYFERLAIINPLLNAAFGVAAGNGALLPTTADIAGNSLFGGSGSFTQALSSVFGSGGTFFSALKTFWSGNVALGGAAPVSTLGGYTGGTLGFVPDYLNGAPGIGGATVPGYGGYGSALGQGLGIAGGIYAGYNRYKSGGGVLGGAAYGVGTYALGAGVASAAAGTGFAAGVGGAFAAVPFIGWAALIAMVVDHFTGGRLFGTSYRPENSQIGFDITQAGGSAWAGVYETKQKAFFGGKTGRWKDIAAPDEAVQAAQQIFDSVQKTMVDGAAALGIAVPPIIEGSFKTITDYDKKGHAKATKTIVDILGKQYEETAEQFATRLNAENLIALADAGGAAGEATKIAERWRSSADALMEGAQTLFAIELDLHNGTKLLADPGGLPAVVDFLDQHAQANEKLADTYVRLMQASAQYLQMVDQIDATISSYGPMGTDTEQALAGIFANADQLRDALNQAAIAAGLTAARAEDLAKIDKLQALQTSALFTALSARIQQEVLDLFGDPIQKQIDAKNTEADAMQDRIDKLYKLGAIQQAIELQDKQAKLRQDATDIAAKKAADDKALQDALKAQTLVKDLADLSIFSGQTLSQLEARFNFSDTDLAKALGIDPSKLNAYFGETVDASKAFIDMPNLQKVTNDILNAILVKVGGTAIVPVPDGINPINVSPSAGDGTTSKGSPTTYNPTVQPTISTRSDGDRDPVAAKLEELISVVKNGNVTRDGHLLEQIEQMRRARYANDRAALLPRIQPRNSIPL